MELWVRSQDKNALRRIYTSLYLKEDLSDYAKGNVWFVVSGGDKLGEYETKERALEVLDEIQNILKPQKIIKTIDNTVKIENAIHIVNPTYETITQLNTYVYEMPED